MSLFKDNDIVPSCQYCCFADYYPIPYLFRFDNPYCSVHKVKCSVDKVCSDFELIGRGAK